MSGKRNTTGIVTRDAIRERRDKMFVAALISMLSIDQTHETAAFNATRAAIKAGFKPSGAHIMANRLLKRPAVKAALDAKIKQLTDKYDCKGERVLSEICKLAFSNLQDYTATNPDGSVTLEWEKLSRDEWAAISQLETETRVDGLRADGTPVRTRTTKLKFHSKLDALHTLAKIQRLILPASGTTINVQNNTLYSSPEYRELQAMQAHELAEFQEFKKQRTLTGVTTPPKAKP
jgi:phage terminase small subunit